MLSSGGVRHPIKHASIFDRDDNRRVASDAESFEVRATLLLPLCSNRFGVCQALRSQQAK